MFSTSWGTTIVGTVDLTQDAELPVVGSQWMLVLDGAPVQLVRVRSAPLEGRGQPGEVDIALEDAVEIDRELVAEGRYRLVHVPAPSLLGSSPSS